MKVCSATIDFLQTKFDDMPEDRWTFIVRALHKVAVLFVNGLLPKCLRHLQLNIRLDGASLERSLVALIENGDGGQCI